MLPNSQLQYNTNAATLTNRYYTKLNDPFLQMLQYNILLFDIFRFTPNSLTHSWQLKDEIVLLLDESDLRVLQFLPPLLLLLQVPHRIRHLLLNRLPLLGALGRLEEGFYLEHQSHPLPVPHCEVGPDVRLDQGTSLSAGGKISRFGVVPETRWGKWSS